MMNTYDEIIIAYLNGSATKEEEKLLLDWLRQDEDHITYFRSMKDVYDLGRSEYDLNNSDVEEEWKRFEYRLNKSKKQRSVFRTGISWLKYVAIFITGIFCMQVVRYITSEKDILVEQTRIETSNGERSKVTLPDGSTIWLNTCSSVTYDNGFGKKERTVLLQGEAFFEVMKNPDQPFIVKSDDFSFRVLGTSFNIYHYQKDNIVNVALVDGLLQVEKDSFSEQLKPGNILSYNKENNLFTLEKSDLRPHTSWRFGELVFDEMYFEDLIKRLERNFNMKFVIENEKIKSERFRGSFHNYESIETILKVISTSTPMQYAFQKDTIYIR